MFRRVLVRIGLFSSGFFSSGLFLGRVLLGCSLFLGGMLLCNGFLGSSLFSSSFLGCGLFCSGFLGSGLFSSHLRGLRGLFRSSLRLLRGYFFCSCLLRGDPPCHCVFCFIAHTTHSLHKKGHAPFCHPDRPPRLADAAIRRRRTYFAHIVTPTVRMPLQRTVQRRRAICFEFYASALAHIRSK